VRNRQLSFIELAIMHYHFHVKICSTKKHNCYTSLITTTLILHTF
jgi:hypothetical protein